MPENYKIIRRSHTQPNDEYDIDFSDRQYKFPLVGCSNYTDKIQVGDVIGIKLINCKNIYENFDYSVHMLEDDQIKNDPDLAYLNKIGYYKRVEEHLFRVIKVKNSKIDVEPVFLDGNKIIVKAVCEEFEKQINVVIDKFNKIDICGNYCNEFMKIDTKEYIYFMYHRLENFINIFMDEKYDKLNKYLPYSDYKETLFNIFTENKDSDHVELIRYLNFIKENESKLMEYLGNDFLEKVGSFDKIVKHMDDMYRQIRFKLGESILVHVTYSLKKNSYLDEPRIIHNIMKVKYADVFRIYKTDPLYVTKKTAHITNWNGIILDESVRDYIRIGNILRIYIIDTKLNHGNVIYVSVLHKITDTRFLACIYNCYLSKYEDIVFVMDIRSITEIPTDWEGNESFELFNNIKSGKGYAVTGCGALKEEADEYNIGFEGILFELNKS